MTPFSSVKRIPSTEFSQTERKSILGTLQRGFCRAPLGDVAHMEQQGRFAAVFHPAGAHFDGNDAAVGSQTFALDPG